VRAALLKALRFAFDWQVVRFPQPLATFSFFLLGLWAFVHTRRRDTDEKRLAYLPIPKPIRNGWVFLKEKKGYVSSFYPRTS
jgi:hypothetical protein